MIKRINEFAKEFLEVTEKKKEILVISHFDTDGITSAAILGRCLKKFDKKFSFKIVKNLSRESIEELPKTKILVFLDLGSGSLPEIFHLPNEVFIIDHHEIGAGINFPKNVRMVNPHIFHSAEALSGSCTTYLVAKELLHQLDAESATLAVIGMVGDILEKNIGPLAKNILEDAGVFIKKGLLLYPSTRPLNKTLEYCSNPYIPGITGNSVGAAEILREAGIEFTKNGYKSLIELDEREMKRIVTAIALRMPDPEKMSEFIGNLFLVKFFDKLEDAREISALINACSRMGSEHISLLMCMGNRTAKKQAEKIYIRYKQNIIDALKQIGVNPKIEGKKYVIMNAKDKIKDTIIGTIASILSMSALYKEGTIIVTMAYDRDKIKVSSRICGREKTADSGRNLKEVMDEITDLIGGESGGHKLAAGCVISNDKEEAFIELVRKKLEIEYVKI